MQDFLKKLYRNWDYDSNGKISVFELEEKLLDEINRKFLIFCLVKIYQKWKLN